MCVPWILHNSNVKLKGSYAYLSTKTQRGIGNEGIPQRLPSELDESVWLAPRPVNTAPAKVPRSHWKASRVLSRGGLDALEKGIVFPKSVMDNKSLLVQPVS